MSISLEVRDIVVIVIG